MALEASTKTSAETLARSVAELLGHEARQLYHLAVALEQIVGVQDATPVIDRALAQLGTWRAQRLPGANPRSLLDVVRAWPDGDLYGITACGWGSMRASTESLYLRVDSAPDLELLVERQRADLFLRSWRALLVGLADRLGASRSDIEVDWDTGSGAATLALTVGDGTSEAGEDVSPEQAAPDAVLASSVDIRAAQYHFLARAFLTAFDATGEHAVRSGIQGFGKERGRALRERHETTGQPRDLHTMMSDFDYGGEGVWQFDPGQLSPHTWSQDCTFCPFAKVWKELDGLDTGYIYDMEFHVAEFSEYNPRIRVQWDKLQTRGDDVCAFRFTLPADS